MKNTWIIFFAFSWIAFSCGTGKYTSSSYTAAYANEKADSYDRKIIYSGSVFLAVEDPYKVNDQIELLAKENGGYVNELGNYRSTIRVVSDSLDPVMEKIKKLGKVKNSSVHGRDVTEEYVDQKIRLENALKARERYLELLAQAENVESALKVEVELERLNEKIELLKGKMNKMNHLSKYATVSVRMKIRKKPGIIGYIGVGIYHSVKWLFVRN